MLTAITVFELKPIPKPLSAPTPPPVTQAHNSRKRPLWLSTATIRRRILEMAKPSDATLQVQMTELNNRSRWYSSQLWQIPLHLSEFPV